MSMNQAVLRKVAAATATVCETLGGSVNVFPLMKTLYLADRQMIIDYGRPITGDTYSSMPKGPILSETYSLIKKRSRLTGFQEKWNSAFSVQGNRLTPKGKINTDCLSKAEEEILKATARRISTLMDCINVADWIHEQCPEWERVKLGSSKPLPVERVVEKSMEISPEKAKELGNAIRDAIRIRNRSALARTPILIPAY